MGNEQTVGEPFRPSPSAALNHRLGLEMPPQVCITQVLKRPICKTFKLQTLSGYKRLPAWLMQKRAGSARKDPQYARGCARERAWRLQGGVPLRAPRAGLRTADTMGPPGQPPAHVHLGRTWPRAPRGCQPSCKALKSPDRPRAGCTRPSGATPSPRTTRKCTTSGAWLNGRRPGRPPVDKGSPPRRWRGSARAQHPPRPSRAFARPASPARGERPCWRLAL